MASLIKSKRRISSISSTRKITNAMELVASVKFKRFKKVMTNGSNYVTSIKEVMTTLNSLNKKEDDDLLINKSNKRLFIIVNSNLGLCASFNNDLFKYLADILTKEDEIIPVGLKGFNHYKDTNFKINANYVSLNEKIDFNNINKFSSFILNEYNLGKYSEVNIVYIDFINTITFKPRMDKLLPLDLSNDKEENLLPPVIEPSASILLDELTPIYLASNIYQAIIVSQVSEQASRRTAMENATDNADELLEKLKLEYNKARQSAITQEISEVVSGANNN